MDSMETKKKLTTILIHVILIIVSITMLVPFIWMILTAFKTVTEATSVDPFTIFPKIWRKDAFISVINNMNFLLLYKNTLLLIFFRVVCAVLTATMAGYAFGRLNFKGRDLCFSLVLFQMMVPVQIFIIPQYLMVSKMGMLNTIFALVFPGIVTAWDCRRIWRRLPDLMDVTSVRPSFTSWHHLQDPVWSHLEFSQLYSHSKI